MKKRQINRAKRFDKTCSNNGSCPYCRSSRLHQANREKVRTDEDLKWVRASYGKSNRNQIPKEEVITE